MSFPPRTLLQNRYQAIRLIGQGGMGVVYEAFDQRLGHTVAIKQITHGDAQAFGREAQLLARLRHPALPKVTDYFVEEKGQFLVMDYIAGDDLATALVRSTQPFSLPQVLAWADQLLDALEYLHSRQPPILHRDIKPANLKLGEDGGIILLDFGLATS
ncbi:serine/threonine protein kinase, partial [candidate division KSB1 bacterium]|nr:serine/threonine protein kinase [candidate division KSB1 bacterium]